jgi:hypothetical protein
MKTILLTNDLKAKCWIASELIDGKPSPELVKYFGTHQLPTPFTNSMSGAEVYRVIQSKNPEAKVIIIVD